MPTRAIQSPDAPAAIGPYSQAIVASAPGNLVFLSGQIALDAQSGELVGEGDVKAQTHRVMRNLAAVLEEAGGGLQHLVKTGIFLASMDDFAAVNKVYEGYLQPPYPARATVAVKTLPRNVLVEIDGIAAL
jgi:2-iminobutanoate/2-iminopropanoate deaminase